MPAQTAVLYIVACGITFRQLQFALVEDKAAGLGLCEGIQALLGQSVPTAKGSTLLW